MEPEVITTGFHPSPTLGSSTASSSHRTTHRYRADSSTPPRADHRSVVGSSVTPVAVMALGGSAGSGQFWTSHTKATASVDDPCSVSGVPGSSSTATRYATLSGVVVGTHVPTPFA